MKYQVTGQLRGNTIQKSHCPNCEGETEKIIVDVRYINTIIDGENEDDTLKKACSNAGFIDEIQWGWYSVEDYG